jgi:predicted GNAT superfamily acetyltransferase
MDADGLPAIRDADPRAATVLIRVPLDIETVRRQHETVARRWRHAVRQVLGGLMSEGARVAGFDRSGWYVVQRSVADGHSASPSARKEGS